MKVSGVIFALEQYDVTTVQQITPLLNLSDPTFGRMIPRKFWSCETAKHCYMPSRWNAGDAGEGIRRWVCDIM